MKINKRKVGEYVVVSLVGEMEMYDAEGFESEVIDGVKKGEKAVIIDFGKLTYMPSSGLRALLNIRSQVQKASGRLKLTGLGDRVLEVLRISKLLSVFEVCLSVEEAASK